MDLNYKIQWLGRHIMMMLLIPGLSGCLKHKCMHAVSIQAIGSHIATVLILIAIIHKQVYIEGLFILLAMCILVDN